MAGLTEPQPVGMRMVKRSPLKPDRPTGAVIFPKSGPIRFETEHLPREQKALEMAVGRKFIGALSHFGHGILADLRPGDEPADLLCTAPEGHFIAIQITELIDVIGATLNANRDLYFKSMLNICSEIMSLFSGCAIEIMDDGSTNFFAPLSRPAGRTMLDQLSGFLADFSKDVHTLGLKKIRTRKRNIGSSQNTVFIACQRHVDAAPNIGYFIRWGRQRSYAASERDSILPSTVRQKIAKSYHKPNDEFWLVVYAIDLIFMADDNAITLTSALLDESPHPFNKVWFFHPYHGRDLGHVIRMWPPNAQCAQAPNRAE